MAGDKKTSRNRTSDPPKAGSSLFDTAGALEAIEGPGGVLSKGVMQG
jgi:hypothetical protein